MGVTQSRPGVAAPLRVVVVCDTFAPDINGSASFAKRLAGELTRRGHEVHVVAASPDGRARTARETHAGAEFTVHRLYSLRWPPHPWLRFALPWRVKANARRILGRVKPDVVHFQSHIVTGAGFAPVARELGIRLVGTNHTMPENIAQHVTVLPGPMIDALVRAQWRSAARIFGMADVVTSPTQRSADYFERMTGLRDVVTISNGIDTSQYSADFSARPGNRIVFVGRLDEEKHVDELIEATGRLDPALDAQVDIVGAGEMRQRWQTLAQRLGVAERVTFHGRISDTELQGILTRGTVFAMPSRAELQCIAAMEAMASALPVVAANAMALPHLVHDGANGYLYEPGDIDGLVSGLTAVLSAPPEELERMKRASQDIVRGHSLAHSVDLFERLYRGEPLEA